MLQNRHGFNTTVLKFNIMLPTYKNTNYIHSVGSGVFQQLPTPNGIYPFRMNAHNFVPEKSSYKIAFIADCGNISNQNESAVTAAIAARNPDFVYIAGDVVYFFGEEENYLEQFFKPFQNVNAPIFAIPGNHDGDLNVAVPNNAKTSLEAFMKVFCSPTVQNIISAHGIDRTSVTQPNPYFTLNFNHFCIIGLYTNVPPGGRVLEDQRDWFISELRDAHTAGQKIIVALHHPPYSCSNTHTGSIWMQELMNYSFAQSGVIPDLIISGHSHNFQLFIQKHSTKILPYIVTGAGGHSLHTMDLSLKLPQAIDSKTALIAYNNADYGFTEVTISENLINIAYYKVDAAGTATLFYSYNI